MIEPKLYDVVLTKYGKGVVFKVDPGDQTAYILYGDEQEMAEWRSWADLTIENKPDPYDIRLERIAIACYPTALIRAHSRGHMASGDRNRMAATEAVCEAQALIRALDEAMKESAAT